MSKYRIARTRDENIDDCIDWAIALVEQLKSYKNDNNESVIVGAYRQIGYRLIDLGILKAKKEGGKQ